MKFKHLFTLFFILILLTNSVSSYSNASNKDIENYIESYLKEYKNLIEENIPISERNEIYFYNNFPYRTIVFRTNPENDYFSFEPGIAVAFEPSEKEEIIFTEINVSNVGLIFINKSSWVTTIAPLGERIIENKLEGLFSISLSNGAQFFIPNNNIIILWYSGLYLDKNSTLYIQDSWIVKGSDLKEDWSRTNAQKDANVSFRGDVSRYNLSSYDLSYEEWEKYSQVTFSALPENKKYKAHLTISEVTGISIIDKTSIFKEILNSWVGWIGTLIFLFIIALAVSIFRKIKRNKSIKNSLKKWFLNLIGIID